MPRTPIPSHLVHRPDDVDRNAERFDQLCRLAEEVSRPVVAEALRREARTTGAEALTEEARAALSGLLEEGVLAGVEEPEVLEQIQRSLGSALPEPEEREWQALTRDTAQMLMGAWLEILRTALASRRFVMLSESLLPVEPHSRVRRVLDFIKPLPLLPPALSEGLASLPLTDQEVAEALATLRTKLFVEHRLVDLPFDLMVVGGPSATAAAMSRQTYESLPHRIPKPQKPVREPASEVVPAWEAGFASARALDAVTYLCEPISRADYDSVVQRIAQV